ARPPRGPPRPVVAPARLRSAGRRRRRPRRARGSGVGRGRGSGDGPDRRGGGHSARPCRPGPSSQRPRPSPWGDRHERPGVGRRRVPGRAERGPGEHRPDRGLRGAAGRPDRAVGGRGGGPGGADGGRRVARFRAGQRRVRPLRSL
ncbi:MAG: Deoxyuridine 5'-triphosphate nucleotidohydrolase, partial [uncultured Acidimicrobiales bacterium]